MFKSILCGSFILLFFLFNNCRNPNDSKSEKEPFLGQSPPGIRPVRFAADIITDSFYPHSKMIISPQGKRIYWTTFLDLNSGDLALCYADFSEGMLSNAEFDTVLSEYGILSFTFINDGNSILFGSRQPYDMMNGHLVRAVWKCDKSGSGWSRPEPVECTLDTNWASLGSVSVNSSGDIYFSGRKEGETAKIYCAKYTNAGYQQVEALPESVNAGITLDPFIDFQDRYLLFAAAGRENNIGIIDLYISCKDQNGQWTAPVNLGPKISTQYLDRFPMVNSDGRYFFFVTSHSDHFPSTFTHFYWADSDVLDDLIPDY